MLTELEMAVVKDCAKRIGKDMLHLRNIPEIIAKRTNKFATATTLAVLECGIGITPKIYLDPKNNFAPPIFFYLGHELRHLKQWEKENSNIMLFLSTGEKIENYKTSAELNYKDYNEQFLEIDAHAFGLICQEEITKTSSLDFLFSDLPSEEAMEMKKKIKKRKKEILQEEFGITVK